MVVLSIGRSKTGQRACVRAHLVTCFLAPRRPSPCTLASFFFCYTPSSTTFSTSFLAYRNVSPPAKIASVSHALKSRSLCFTWSSSLHTQTYIVDMWNPSIKSKLELLKLHNCLGPSLRVNRRASLSFLKVLIIYLIR